MVGTAVRMVAAAVHTVLMAVQVIWVIVHIVEVAHMAQAVCWSLLFVSDCSNANKRPGKSVTLGNHVVLT